MQKLPSNYHNFFYKCSPYEKKSNTLKIKGYILCLTSMKYFFGLGHKLIF